MKLSSEVWINLFLKYLDFEILIISEGFLCWLIISKNIQVNNCNIRRYINSHLFLLEESKNELFLCIKVNESVIPGKA